MLFSWNWLNEIVDVDGLDPMEVAERLSLAGLEVEGVTVHGGGLEGVVAGHVVGLRPHPGADRLRIATVDAGEAHGSVDVVCGAPNVAVGLMVPFAPPGVTLPNGLTLGVAAIRGVESRGMLCSAQELGLEDGEDGLLVLPGNTAPGTAVGDSLGLPDHVFELSLTPNRADCLSVRGVAREVAVLFERPWRPGSGSAALEWAEGARVGEITLDVQDAAGCPRYAAAVVHGVGDGPSPGWMQRRLRACGVRPVSRVVDVTNYVMLETGQPLHAFDLEAIVGDAVVVRAARPGERMEGIDHIERTLDADDLVIADAAGPIAIAGVMGGVRTEVSASTRRILIECAHFAPQRVRRAARRHGLHTEASHRFERGVDPQGLAAVLARMVWLLSRVEAEFGGHAMVSSPAAVVGPGTGQAQPILLPVGFSERHLGIAVCAAREEEVLGGLGFVVRPAESGLEVTAPSWRFDIARPIDLVEEVARVVGYDRIPAELPAMVSGMPPTRREDAPHPQSWQPVVAASRLAELVEVRRSLAAGGWSETVHFAFADPERQRLLLGEQVLAGVRLANPLGEESALLRWTLLEGLLRSVQRNMAHSAERVALFECGRTFENAGGPEGLPERQRLAGVLTGLGDLGWAAGGRAADGFDVRGALDRLAGVLRRPIAVRTCAPDKDVPPWLHPGVQGAICADGNRIGWLGAVHPEVLEVFDLDGSVYAFELDLDAWLDQPARRMAARPVPRFPGSSRDCALLVPVDVPFHALAEAVEQGRHAWLESWRLFDVYEGKGVPAGRRSLGIRVVYRNPEGTMVDEAVEQIHQALVGHLLERLGATLRG